MFIQTSFLRLVLLSNPWKISLILSLVSHWVPCRAGSIMQTSLPSSTQFESCSFPSFETLQCTCMFCFCNYRKREKATCETFHIIIARVGLNCMYYWIFTYRVCCGHFFLIVFLCFVITSTRLIFPLIVTFIKKWQLREQKVTLLAIKKLKWLHNFPLPSLHFSRPLLCQVNSSPHLVREEQNKVETFVDPYFVMSVLELCW